ncbi:SDR family oxidoreductase [Plantibacter sp. VKM Ac-2876]|uniref:SDR family oxidoreductase n=1 Tax=Plantibacter sp. VKM Ac-2876 TaxID=2783826 RepID=UPI00188CDD48|nr:SDR family oxidoreductase [Plantibacter sp. VKM Ac-2876]MBF4565894.1 SDR family oxidoreductase [Plantibacter sp. VKM Ac-2876]
MTDRVLWVTGGGSGMGQAVAVSAAEAGWRVAVTGRRREALLETVGAITSADGVAVAAEADATDPISLARAHDRILAELGPVDDLVTAAGLNAPRRRWDDQSMTEFAAIVDTNLTSVARTIDLALPTIRDAQGRIVVISSFAGWRFSTKGGVAYSASKTALASLCATLNEEEGAHGVGATHLCPGDVDTPFLSMRPQVPDASARETMLTPEDIGRAVRFILDGPPHVRIDELVISPTRPSARA